MTIEKRLDKLERSHRRWRWTASILGLLLIAILTAGQASYPKMMTLNRLDIKDDKGSVRIRLMDHSITLYDSKGHTRIRIGFDGESAYVSHIDKAGVERHRTGTMMMLGDFVALTQLSDKNGRLRIDYGVAANGTSYMTQFHVGGRRVDIMQQ